MNTLANIIQINGKNVKDSTAARMASLAPVEASTTATAAHAVGECFWLGGTLYEATAAIAVGDTITVGTNCNAANINNMAQPDWNQATTTARDYIKNKPAIRQQANGGILENNATDASGQYSHAEGDLATASGVCSHAEGGNTNASGVCSHTEGGTTAASGNYSHAEGGSTTASGYASHAEGGGTTASGASSHAEGGGTTASGDNSHAEGGGTIANHFSQHVFGMLNVADTSNNDSSQRGNFVEIVGNGLDVSRRSNARTLDWEGNEEVAGDIIAYGCGGANPISLADIKSQIDASPVESGSTAGSVQTKAFAVGSVQVTQQAVGLGSFAEGYNTIAYSDATHAEGQGSVALSMASHAEGCYTYSGARVAHAEGMFTICTSKYSHSEGQGSFIQCKLTGEENATTYSFSSSDKDNIQVGYVITMTGIASARYINAVDRINNTITLSDSFGIQLNKSVAYIRMSYAKGMSSHVEGIGTNTLGSGSHAEGQNTFTYGSSAHSEGSNTYAFGDNSHAEGFNTLAYGSNSHAQNRSTLAYGSNSHAQNVGAYITLTISGEENATTYSYTGDSDPNVGDYIVFLGKCAKITSVDTVNHEFTVDNTLTYYVNQKSVTVYQSGAFGANSHVEGKGTTAMGNEQHAQGRYNVLDNDGVYAEIVGNGTAHNARSNARTLDWDGNESLAGGITLGKGTEDEVTLNAAQLKQLLALLN